MAPAIRPATPSDIAAILEIENHAFTTDRLSPRSLKRLVGSPAAALLVAGTGGGLDGYALVLFRRGARVARLYSLATAEAARGRGLASALLGAAEAETGRRGARALRLEVRRDNAAARALYRNRGYCEIGERADYYQDGTDAVRMELAIPAMIEAAGAVP